MKTHGVITEAGLGHIQALSALQRRPRSRLEGRRRLAITLPPEVVRPGSYKPPHRLYLDSSRPCLRVWAFRSGAASGLR